MVPSDPGIPQAPHGPAPVRRRRFMEALLGSGFFLSAAAFFYPVLRFLIPPKESDMGSGSVVAARVGELK
ncbi:MAG: hypothetical protein ACXV9O_12775, partial [Candidatus Angelobacter sp.]